MAIKNPTSTDFKVHQKRGIDYKSYYYPSDLMKLVGMYLKNTVYTQLADADILNMINQGLGINAWLYDSDSDGNTDKVEIQVNRGTWVQDNQTIRFDEDFIFEYDKPDSDENYYIYLKYSYVDSYPGNIATIVIYNNEITGSDLIYLGSVYYSSENDIVTVNENGNSRQTYPGMPVYINISGDFQSKENNFIIADTSNSGFTVTLPPEEECGEGTRIIIADSKGTFNDNPVTLHTDDSDVTIAGEIGDLDLDVNNKMYTIIFNSTDNNWMVF